MEKYAQGVSPRAGSPPERHPAVLEPASLLLNIGMAVIGAIIGMQLITQLGITANTSIIGALVAMLVARVPIRVLSDFRSIYRQNLIQTSISGATFGAANALLLPIGIPYILGRPDLIWPMLLGAAAGLFIDGYVLYRVFDSRVFPATGTWPPGVATGEAILAGDEGGRRAWLLVGGTVVGIIGSILKIPMSAFGVAFIGNVWALAMFGVGLLLRGYSTPVFGIDINALYIPHGVMIGAGLVALIQIINILRHKMAAEPAPSEEEESEISGGPAITVDEKSLGQGLTFGFSLFVLGAILLATLGGLWTEMSLGQMILWVLFAAVAAMVSELIVGLSAMHAGWFPAFATALIFLVLGMIIGFPMVPLALLVGYTASTGPAFADMGYDLKSGWMLRKRVKSLEFEMEGRRQQFFAEVIGFAVGLVMVALFWNGYFSQDLIPPVDRVFAATIEAGLSDPSITTKLLLFAIPGAIIQWIGGPARQIGILFATGLLINFPVAGWTVLAGILIRIAILRFYGKQAETPMSIAAAGFIAGDAIYSFFTSIFKLR